jgi:SAM-dependent methyltransferase
MGRTSDHNDQSQVRIHNREAWNKQVDTGNRWTVPVDRAATDRARAGDWTILLTPRKPVPRDWFPSLSGIHVLCLASGGGQQGPILAAAGARVTVYDNAPAQLDRDRMVAQRDGLAIRTIEGDMRDLSALADESFDLIVHPVSNVFIPNLEPLWRECHRVLRPGAYLLAGFDNPALYLFDEEAYERGELLITRSLPYSDLETLSEAEIERRRSEGAPLEFGHSLESQIGGQIEAGFVIVGLYEDRYDPEEDALSRFMPTFLATRALRPS